MRLKGIIFDKDGTLFDYYTVWSPVLKESMDLALEKLNRKGDEELKKRILRLMGIGDTNVHPDGLIFKSNNLSMFISIFFFSLRNRISYRKLIRGFKEGYYDSKDLLKDSLAKIPPEDDVSHVFEILKEAGYNIGIVTSDNSESTKVCLEQLKIDRYVDFLSTYDDDLAKKPSPGSFKAFCSQFRLEPAEVAVVGDAPVDMRFAKRSKAGYAVAVLTGSNNVRHLSLSADIIYPNLHSILDDPVIFPKE